MRIYFDTCTLQRPGDDRSQLRVSLEAEAILSLLAFCEQKRAALVVSDVILFETMNNPNPQRQAFVSEIIQEAAEHLAFSACIGSGGYHMSIVPQLSLTEITEKALRLLIKEMGIANTARFINQFHTGTGDAIEEKERLFGSLSVEELADAIRKSKQNVQE